MILIISHISSLATWGLNYLLSQSTNLPGSGRRFQTYDRALTQITTARFTMSKPYVDMKLTNINVHR